MSGHTPKPWKACGTIYEHMNCEIRSGAKGEGQGIAQVWDGPNAFRDGLLIAAAPDLLEALREARTTLAMLKRNVVTEIARHDGLLRWEGVPEAIQARIDECDAAITRADGGGA